MLMQIILKNQSFPPSGVEFRSFPSPFWLFVKGALLTVTDNANECSVHLLF